MGEIHLGFVDVPYPGQVQRRGKRGRFLRKEERSIDVAEDLEEKYHIVETFAELALAEIAEELEVDYTEQLDELFETGRSRSGSGKFSRKVTLSFRNFLQEGGMDSLVRGVPTKASLAGKTWRPDFNKTPVGQSRPSFIDTGTYIGAFRAWID